MNQILRFTLSVLLLACAIASQSTPATSSDQLDFESMAALTATLQRMSQKIADLTLKYELSIAQTNRSCFVYSSDEAFNANEWLLVSSRIGRTHNNFKRSMAEYKTGFGDPLADYWIGLDKLHKLTLEPKVVRFEFLAYSQPTNVYFYEHAKFQVADESDKYRLSVGARIRAAEWPSAGADQFFESNGMHFTTEAVKSCFESQTIYTNAGWWLSNKYQDKECTPIFCPICNLMTIQAQKSYEYIMWDESRIYIK